MNVGVSKSALAAAAFGAVVLSAPVPARADTAAEIRELRARLRGLDDLRARLGRLEAQAAKEAKNAKVHATNHHSRTPPDAPGYVPVAAAHPPEHWYDHISLRGYTQLRYNGIMSGGPFFNDISSPHDRSIGNKRNFFIRRARLIFSGDVSDHLYIYIQPDLASAPNRSFSNASTFTSSTTGAPLTNAVFGTAGGQVGTYSDSAGGNFAQLRDAYADISIDHDKEFRFRAGQSKIPYGFENMQSSQNRLALDRADAINTCCKDERDLGLFFYYAPKEMRKLFRELVTKNLKGSGDYGMFALGVYNGQGANRFELNTNVHVVSRLTYPYVFANGQIVEASIQGYTGRFMPTTASITPSLFGATFDAGFRPPGFFAAGVPFVNGSGYGDAGNYNLATFPSSTAWRPVFANGGVGVRDQRLAVSGVLYPQPFGLSAEWNWGVGPRLNETQTVISARSLNGGYVQATYKYDDKMYGTGTWFPFVKWQYYRGGAKNDTNAPLSRLYEFDAGIEWQPLREVEFTVDYSWMDRTNTLAAPYRQFHANLMRFQLQWNY